MKIRIDGHELLVKKTTRGMVEWQRQSGLQLTEMSKMEVAGYAPAMSAFFALHNAGFNPQWEDLLDRDVEEFQLIQEPGDNRATGDAPEPARSPEASDPAADEGAPAAQPGSKRSSPRKVGSKTK